MKTIDQRLGYDFPVLLHLFTVFFHCSISKKLYFLFEKISQNKQNRKDIFVREYLNQYYNETIYLIAMAEQ